MRKKQERCQVCGFRNRSKKHNDGIHHQRRRPKNRRLRIKGTNKDDLKV